MNIFKPITLTWWQIGVIKVCLISLGIILGVQYFVFFYTYLSKIVILFAVTALYLVVLRFQHNAKSR